MRKNGTERRKNRKMMMTKNDYEVVVFDSRQNKIVKNGVENGWRTRDRRKSVDNKNISRMNNNSHCLTAITAWVVNFSTTHYPPTLRNALSSPTAVVLWSKTTKNPDVSG